MKHRIEDQVNKLKEIRDRQGFLLKMADDSIRASKLIAEHGHYYYIDTTSNQDKLYVLVRVEESKHEIKCDGPIKRIRSYLKIRQIPEEMIIDLRWKQDEQGPNNI